jgi:hypothetical protein
MRIGAFHREAVRLRSRNRPHRIKSFTKSETVIPVKAENLFIAAALSELSVTFTYNVTHGSNFPAILFFLLRAAA